MSRGILLALLLVAAQGCATTTTTVEPLGASPMIGNEAQAADQAVQPEPSAAPVVILRLKIGPDGAVRDAQVVQSAGPDADDAALKAVYKLHFNPAQKDGEPVESTIRFAFTF
jgi:TonB family protein